MWLLTTDGFYSAVRKPGGEGITIRARCAADLDRLRAKWLPTLSPTISGAGTDYPHRATCGVAAYAKAVAAIASAIDYDNFKHAVGERRGHAHADAYHRVWSDLKRLEAIPAEKPPTASIAPPPAPPAGSLAYGAVVIHPDRQRILLREPAGHFGGYVWTFAKGKAERGEAPLDAALREVGEELAIAGRPLVSIPQWFVGTTGATWFCILEWQRNLGTPTPETAAVRWAGWDEAATLIAKTTTKAGQERDLAVLAAARDIAPSLPR